MLQVRLGAQTPREAAAAMQAAREPPFAIKHFKRTLMAEARAEERHKLQQQVEQHKAGAGNDADVGGTDGEDADGDASNVASLGGQGSSDGLSGEAAAAAAEAAAALAAAEAELLACDDAAANAAAGSVAEPDTLGTSKQFGSSFEEQEAAAACRGRAAKSKRRARFKLRSAGKPKR